ncbi:MAG: hypothetical protein ACT4RN_03230 [Pseudonocardia sp.]
MTDGPLSRAELLGGLSGRRVSTALFAVESRTAYLHQQARHAAAPCILDGVTAQRERAFLAALAAGRDLPATVTAAQLERHARRWAHLAPADAGGRAELAHRLGAKYRFRARDVPRLREVLALDSAPVRAEYVRRHGHPLDAVFTAELRPAERFAWWRAGVATRLAELPPFWAAFGLTLTETVGAGTLALPIALAGVGPLPGVALVAVLGLVNVLTIVAFAETFTRSGAARWGGAYLPRVVRELLGRVPAAVFGAGLFAFCLVALLAYYVGFATTLAASTGVDATVWAAVLLAGILLLLRRGGLDATVASALVVGAVNIGIVVLLSVLALTRLDPAFLRHVAIDADGAVLGLVFGVVLFAFFGHTSVANCARVVLHRDPGGRALVAGAAAATLTAIGVYGLWVVAVGAAVAPARLAAEHGTALVPLAEVVGAPAVLAGAVFAVLAMGMAAVHFSWGLYHQARDRGGAAWVGLAPVVGVFVLVEVLLLTGRESFTGQVGIVGALTLPLLAGVVPVLVLAAARRRGECVPARPPLRRGGALVGALLYLLFLAALLAHGLVIWEHPVQRALALGAAAVAVGMTVVAVRSGRFVARLAVELRRDTETGRRQLVLTARGAPLAAPVRFGQGEPRPLGDGELDPSVAAVAVALPELPGVRDLTVRLHAVDQAGRSEPLPGAVRLDDRPVRIDRGTGSAALPPGPHVLHLVLDGPLDPATGGPT